MNNMINQYNEIPFNFSCVKSLTKFAPIAMVIVLGITFGVLYGNSGV